MDLIPMLSVQFSEIFVKIDCIDIFREVLLI